MELISFFNVLLRKWQRRWMTMKKTIWIVLLAALLLLAGSLGAAQAEVISQFGMLASLLLQAFSFANY